MEILKGLFRMRDAPKNKTSGSSYSFFMGNSTSGKRVNERSSMQMTAVYSCVRILSEAVASLPLHFYKYGENGSKVKAIDHPLYRLLHDEPNPEMTSFVFRETLMTHLLLWGNAYAQVIRNGKGEVVALYPLMPDRMKMDREEHGALYYEYQVSKDDAPTNKGASVKLTPDEVMHIPGLGFDGLVGYSPIAMAKNAIGLAIAAEEYGSKFYATANLQGVPVKPSPSPSKSIDAIAREVIRGGWGNGADRKARLESAGYNYSAVQERVNELLYGSNAPSPSPSKSVDAIAREVIRGDWGNGADRKTRLESAGYSYSAVQERVNEILYGSNTSAPSKSIDTIAREVIRGDWGNGQDRKNRLAMRECLLTSTHSILMVIRVLPVVLEIFRRLEMESLLVVAVLQWMTLVQRKMTISYLNLNEPFNFWQAVEEYSLPSVLLWKEVRM